MSIREKIIENNRLSIGIASVVIMGALIAIYSQTRATSTVVLGTDAQAFYSDDYGSTWFTDVSPKVVPFSRSGKDVVRAFVFKPEAGGKPFTGYLMRYSTAGMAELARAQKVRDAAEKAIKASPGGGADGNYTLPPVPYEDMRLQEVKAPGTIGEWVAYVGAAGQKIITVKAPDGGAAVPVTP